MAINISLRFTQNINGTSGIIEDVTTDYGVGDNPLRTSVANYLLYSHNTDANERVYYNVVNSAPLSQMLWNVITTDQGWTQATLFTFDTWLNNISYLQELKDSQGIITQYASVIYYIPTNKVYKAIQSHLNVAPDASNGTSFWEEVIDFTTLLNYVSVKQHTVDFQVDYEINKFVTKGFLDIYDTCGCTSDLSKLEPAIRNWAYYMSATANFQNSSPEKMDLIIENLDKISKTC